MGSHYVAYTDAATDDNKNDTGFLGIAAEGWGPRTMAASINVQFKRTPILYAKWQLDTYTAIMQAYRQKKREAEEALAQAETQAGIMMDGTNPLFNQQIILSELKKLSIHWLANGGNNGINNDGWVNINQTFDNWCVYNDGAGAVWNMGDNQIREGRWAKFMESVFDWNLMTYEFLPYFYGSPGNWRAAHRAENADPLFLNFLQAGMAKVVVPVTPDREHDALYFYENFEMPNVGSTGLGLTGNAKTILDDLRNKKAQNTPSEAFPKTLKMWKVNLPTSLVILQGKTGVNQGNGGLPIMADTNTPFVFAPSLLQDTHTGGDV
jgi:hypothetical protein